MKPSAAAARAPALAGRGARAAGRARRRREGARGRAEPHAACSTSGSPRRRVLVDLGQVPALALIDIADGAVRVGAMCSQRDLERHAEALAACPLLRARAALRRARRDAQPRHGRRLDRARRCRGRAAAGAADAGGRGRGDRAVGRAARARRGVLRLAPDELPRAGRARDRGALPRLRRRAGARASPRSLRATATTRCAPSPARCASRTASSRRRGSGRAPSPTVPCACRPPSASLVGTRCEPEALAAAAEARAPASTRATACTPRRSTGATSRACSPAAAAERAYAMATAT